MLEKLSPILPTRNMPACERFYSDLRFRTVYADDSYLLMKRDHAEVHFFLHEALDPAHNNHGAYLRPADANALIDRDGNLIRAGQEIPGWDDDAIDGEAERG
jgi:catechol 2,3-dioxygenase-like lactoylglutathione lyase family enzyme